MATKDLSSVSLRIKEASSVLGLQDHSKLLAILNSIGVDTGSLGLGLLDSGICTQEYIEGILSTDFKDTGILLIKAAAQYLKGIDPFEKKQEAPQIESSTEANVLLEYLRINKPIAQMRDDELITVWSTNRDSEIENELHKRSRGQAFIVLKSGKHTPGKEEIDIPQSLELLKNARKRVNPSIIPYENNTFATVYKISELNINDRIIETCPICGEILWKGYCPSCEMSLASIGSDERSYVKLVVDSGRVNVKSAGDRKALVVSAGLGLDDLKVTWPGIFKQFEELKATGNLPKLRRIADRPAKMQTQDPFHVAGNRQY